MKHKTFQKFSLNVFTRSQIWRSWRPGNRADSPDPTVWKLLFNALQHSTSIMNRSAILYKYHISRIALMSWEQIVSKYPFFTLSLMTFQTSKTGGRNILLCEKTGHAITEVKLCGAFYTCFGRSEPHIRHFWLFRFPDIENLHSSEKVVLEIRIQFLTHYDNIEQNQSS